MHTFKSLLKPAPLTHLRNALVLAVLTTACASTPEFPRPLSGTSWSDTEGSTQTIAIMGINDFHGALFSRSALTREKPGIDPLPYTTGGAATLGAHVKLLRSVFQDNFILLDAGDEFQGTIESNADEGAPVVQFYNLIGVNAAAVGNHEFDFGISGPDRTARDSTQDLQEALKKRMTEAHYPYLSSNITERATHKPWAPKNLAPSTILISGKLKVGVIGLSTESTPVTTRPEYVRNLEFSALKASTLREAKKLRDQGAHIVVALAHAGLVCDRSRHENSGVQLFSEPTGGTQDAECGASDEIVQLLSSIPKGTVDAVVAGHTHQIVHHWITGVPVIQAGASGQHYNLLYLTYDWKQKKLLTAQTRIEGPVPVCEKVFENQGDCNGNRPAPKKGRGKLVTPVFHGAKIHADSQVEEFLKPLEKRTQEMKLKVVGKAVRPIEHQRQRESEMGNLITDALKKAAGTTAAIANPGGIRANLEQGDITYESVFRAFPFDNAINVLTVTGKELKLILRVAQSGSRGFFPVAGLKLKLIKLESSAPSNDLNKNKKIDPWEFNRLVEVRLSNGKLIDDKRTYTLAIPDFLVNGGDDMGFAIEKLSASRIKRDGAGLMREALVDYLAVSGPVNSVENPLVNPNSPRIQQVNPPARRGKRKRG